MCNTTRRFSDNIWYSNLVDTVYTTSCLHEDGYQWQPLFSLTSSPFLLWFSNHIQQGSLIPHSHKQKAEPCLNPAALINLTDFVNYLFGWLTDWLSWWMWTCPSLKYFGCNATTEKNLSGPALVASSRRGGGSPSVTSFFLAFIRRETSHF